MVAKGNTIKSILMARLFDESHSVEDALKKLVGIYFDEAQIATAINEDSEEQDEEKV